MKKTRNILAIIFASLILFSSITTCFALDDANGSIEPRATYKYVYTPNSTINYTNGKIVGEVNIAGRNSSVTYNGTVSIQRKYGLIWIDIEEWTGLTGTDNFYFSNNSITPAEGATYRVKYNVKATYSGDTETVSGNSASAAYNP